MDARLIVMFHLILMVQGNVRDKEPRCYSSFDFQEKLLEKMVSLTMTVNAIETKMDKKLQELNEASEKLKEDRLAMESDFTKLESQLKHEFKHHEEKLKELKLATESDFTQLETHLKHEIKHAVETMKETQGNTLDANTQKIDGALENMDAKFGRLSEDFYTMTNSSLKEIQDSIKPNVAFLARTVSDTSPYQNTQLVFTNAIHNTDNSYSTSTGEFTAPVGGTYWFSTQICGNPGKSVNFRIFVNYVMMSDTTHYDSDYYSCTSSDTVAILSKGDRVYVMSGPGTHSGTVINQAECLWSVFMGSLVN